MAGSEYKRPTVSAAPTMPPLLMPQPSIAPLLPPAHVVNLMTEEGSAAFGARWRGEGGEDRRMPGACPTRCRNSPRPTTSNRMRNCSASMIPAWPEVAATDLGARRGGGMVSFFWFRATLTMPARVADFGTAGTKAVFTVNVDDYAEVWVNGVYAARGGQAQSGGDPGVQHAESSGAAGYRRARREV